MDFVNAELLVDDEDDQRGERNPEPWQHAMLS
jgi:hypothetical protein